MSGMLDKEVSLYVQCAFLKFSSFHRLNLPFLFLQTNAETIDFMS